MGVLSTLFGRDPVVALAAEREAEFAVSDASVIDAAAIPPEVFGLTSYALPTAIAPRVSRREAMQVPAMRRAVDLVSTLGTLPIEVVRPDLTVERASWLTQPEADVPGPVTYARTIADLALDSIAWWRVTAFDWAGYPARVVRLDPRSVDVLPDARVHVTSDDHRGTAAEWPKDGELIRFEMPGAGWLTDGARAIRQCLLLDASAQRAASGLPPVDWFTAADGADPDEDEVREFLDRWHLARQTRSTAYVPTGLEYHVGGFNADQAEMAEARNHAVLELARVTGIDAEELGISTTSRSYFNGQDRRRQFTDFVLGGFRSVIEGRLSMGDVTKRGHRVRFNLSDFLRSDDLTRMQVHELALRIGAETDEEMRQAEGRPPLSSAQRSALAPSAPVPTSEPQAVLA